MADAPGEDVALLLLRALPTDVAGTILGRLGGEVAERLRKRLSTAPATPLTGNDLDAALGQFFDLQRIAGRTPGTGEYRPVAPPPPAAPATPVDELRGLPPDRLARALEGEQVGTIALILSCLDPTAAGQVMKRLPLDSRAEIAVRMTKLGARNQVLLQQLARAVADKGRRLGDVPPEPSQEEVITNLADMLRALPRGERFPVIRKIETVDAELAAKVMEKLSRIEDLLKNPGPPTPGAARQTGCEDDCNSVKDGSTLDKRKSNFEHVEPFTNGTRGGERTSWRCRAFTGAGGAGQGAGTDP